MVQAVLLRRWQLLECFCEMEDERKLLTAVNMVLTSTLSLFSTELVNLVGTVMTYLS